jgi:hypothetical protein
MSILHVITHRAWVADDLKGGAHVGVTVRHDLGFDAPEIAPGDAVWVPMESAARIFHDARIDAPPIHLADPGPHFTPSMPVDLLGRRLSVGSYDDLLRSGTEEAFVKPANCKIENFPAQWWYRAFSNSFLSGAPIPDDLVLHWTPTRLDLVEEHRIFVIDKSIATSSPYLIDGETWHETMQGDTCAAESFAQGVLDAVDEQPRSYTLDVGRLRDRSWVVIETNPVWSSAQYGADPAQVVRCLFAAATPDSTKWDWRPDPYLLVRVQKQRPLTSQRSR